MIDYLSFLNVDLFLYIYCVTVVFNDVITFIDDVNLNDGVPDVHYNQCISD